jgi:hypothetical protein
MKGLPVRLDLVTWTVVLADVCRQGDVLASDGTVDAFPVFGRIVETTLEDTFWAAGAAVATLFAGSFSKWSG